MDEYFNGIGESLREHLRRINAGEADAWLEEQWTKWSCPFCGSPVFWEEKTCPSCGKPLK
jgi:rubrerythrin